MKLLFLLLNFYDLRISFSPPKIGGVRGGISEGNHLKKKLIRFTLTPPNLLAMYGEESNA